MVSSDPVSIVVEIIDQFSDDLAELRAQLAALDATDIDVDFDIDGDGEIESVRARLAALQAMDLDFGGGAPALPGETFPNRQPALPAPDTLPVVRGGGGGGGGGGAGRMGRRIRDILTVDNAGMKARRSMNALGNAIDSVRPRMQMVWNLLAALIPILVTLGAGAIGLAASLGAVAAAGAAIIGVGLLGWGEDFSSSMENLNEQAQQLGSRLFDVMQPAAGTFQPIVEDWMEGAPAQAQELVGPMKNLAVFADTISAAGAGFVDWLVEVMNSMVSMQGVIDQLVLKFGNLLGQGLITLFEGLIRFTYENQEALIQLTSSLVALMGALLDVSVALSSTLATLSPLVDIIVIAADLLNSTFGRALLTGVTAVLLLEGALGALYATMAVAQGGFIAFAGGIISTYLPSIYSAIAGTWAWVTALSALQAALLATGIGALIVGGGFLLNQMIGPNQQRNPPTRGSSGPSRGGNTYIQIQGDVGQREADRILDQTNGVARTEMDIQEDMEGET